MEIQNFILGLVGHCITTINTVIKSAKSTAINACSGYCLNGATCTTIGTNNVTCICTKDYQGLINFIFKLY